MPDVVIGLGNRFVHDDGAGLEVVAELRRRGLAGKGVEIRGYEEMDLSLLEEFGGASRIVIVDSMKSGTKPGTVSLYEVAEDPGEVSLPSLHELELSGMVGLARRMGVVSCPVLIVGIEPADLSVGEGLSREVRSAVPAAVEAVLAQLAKGAP